MTNMQRPAKQLMFEIVQIRKLILLLCVPSLYPRSLNVCDAIVTYITKIYVAQFHIKQMTEFSQFIYD